MTRRWTRVGGEGQWVRSLVPMLARVLLASVVASESGWAAHSGEPEAGEPEQTAKGAPAKEQAKSAATTTASPSPAAAAPIVYVPPSRGRARHTAGAGTRGVGSGLPNGKPRVAVLAPRDHVGLTASAHPRLYWQLSEPTATRIELTVVDDEAIEPLIELSMPGPVAAGLHALDLGALGIALEPDKTYRWFVAVVHDPRRRSRDELAEGAIERIEVSGAQAADATTGAASGEHAAAELRSASLENARAGLWYDAFADLEDAIERDPSNGGLRADRASLLAQGNLAVELR